MRFCECGCGRELSPRKKRWYENSCKNKFNSAARKAGEIAIKYAGSMAGKRDK